MSPLILLLALTAADANAAPATSDPAPSHAADTRTLTLDEAQRMAHENNLDLRIASERLARAAILSRKAWALILPVISASASVTRFDKEIVIPFGLPASLEPLFQSLGQPFPPPQNVTIQNLYGKNASVGFNWSLLNGRSVPLIQNAYSYVEVADLGFQQAETALRFGTALSYYAVLNTQEQVAIRHRALELANEHLKLANARAELGSATQVESLRSEVEVATAEQNLILAQNGERIALQALATLIGAVRADGTMQPFRLVHPSEESTAADGDLLAMAVEQRLDLKARAIELEIAERSKSESWMKFLPMLVGTGSYRWSDAEGFSGENTNWQVGLALSWTLFEGGLTYWELQEREHDIQTAALLIEKTRQDIGQQVHDARVDLASAEANREAATRRVELARKSAELVAAQYELGGATQLDLLDANRALADAETANALARLSVDLARLSLEQVMLIPPANGGATAAAADGDAASASDALSASTSGGAAPAGQGGP